MNWLLAVEPWQGEKTRVEVGEQPVVLGRGEGCAVLLADTQVSRQHSRIFERDGGLWIEDLGSRNGTKVNGLRITEAKRLSEGDLIEIALNRIYLRRGSITTSAPLVEESSGMRTLFRDASRSLSDLYEKTDQRNTAAELKQYAERLRMINDVHQAMVSAASAPEALELLLDRVFRFLAPERAAVVLFGPNQDQRLTVSRPQGLAPEGILGSRSLLHEVVEKRVAALVFDAPTDDRFAGAQSILDSGVKSLLAAPLLAPDRVLGLIVLSSSLRVRQFTDQDIDTLVPLASATAIHVHNLELRLEADERRRLEQELNLARRIQEALLPERLPEIVDYELSAGNIPSRGVSGDLYSATLRHAGRECVLMVADVSGKGMGASLMGASLDALSVGPIEVGHDAAAICTRVARRLYERTPPEKYATAFVAVLDREAHSLKWTNAGHNPALLVRADGEIERLAATGPPLGLLPEAAFELGMDHLEVGDLIVIYTDGVTEAFNPADDEFGLERLCELCKKLRTAPLSVLRDSIDSELNKFVRGRPFADDRTLMLLRRAR